MIAWMLYTIAIGLCVAAAATAADLLLRLVRRPTRFVWLGAALLCSALGAIAPLRARPAHKESRTSVDLSSLALVQTSLRSVERRVSPATTWYIAGLWGLASLFASGCCVLTYARMRHARRSWPMVDLHGHRVRLSPGLGPIVIGIARPEIIVPRWVLLRSEDEQRVVVSHEASHVDAGDPIVLAATCALVAIMPWNPALWIMLARMRLAIEVDCDARVLGEGVSSRSYGSLLIDVAERSTRVRFAATALADDSSHLHQRILAMQPRRFTRPILRGASAAFLGLAALLAACEAKMPTATEIQQMDAGTAERSAKALGMVKTDSALAWWVDGVATTERAAKAIPEDSLARVEVDKADGRGRIYLYTKGNRTVQFAKKVDSVQLNRGEAERSEAQLREMRAAAGREGAPILIIDGVRSDPSVLKTIDRARIDNVDVLKGELAKSLYGADAANGVIVVRTKAAEKR
ncbi:MAG TPA: M56 family metallopeptidase [Gemmatimonadaceae bacterium]|jgi:TonB-dependent SusC/RagA subfamily outer membrane receptor